MRKPPQFNPLAGSPKFQPIRQGKPLTDPERIERHRFYGRESWQKLRRSYLKDNPECEACLQKGVHILAFHVHHKLDVKDAPKLKLDRENLQALCHSCHSKLTWRHNQLNRRKGDRA